MTEEERRANFLGCQKPEYLAERIAKAISHLDVSKTARHFGDVGSAEGAHQAARDILLSLLGID